MTLNGLKICRCEFDLEAVDTVDLPRFAGSAFRGVLGWALKRAACRQVRPCPECRQPETCPYTYLFETPGDEPGRAEAPRPFVLQPPFGSRRIARGEPFPMGLVLLGRGHDYLAYFLHCMEEMGRRGVQRQRFRVLRAYARGPDGERLLFYEGGRRGPGRLLAEPRSWPLAEITRRAKGLEGARRVEVRYLTPTRLVHRGERCDRPEFHILVRALLRRLDMLMRFHGEGPLEADYRRLVKRAEECPLGSCDVRWFDWSRRSARQQRSMRLGGVIGTVCYEGPMGEFLPLLLAGSAVHVGKATTFGMGRYDVSILP